MSETGTPIKSQSAITSSKIWMLAGIVTGLYLIYMLVLSDMMIASIVGVLPIALVAFLFIAKYYHRIFYLLFISHFAFLCISSFTDIKIGAFTIAFNAAIFVLIIVISVYKKTSWKKSWNGMLTLFCIWGAYCIAELANPNTVMEAWNTSMVYYLAYPIVCGILIPLTIRKYRNVEWMLILWSIFILIAVAKGYWQKNQGFTDRELAFLFEQGAARTHIIWSGIRYFSVFTDAANFGVHMAMAITCFGISAFYHKNKWLKLYFLVIVVAASYGMMISGTRTAMAVPIGGLLALMLFSLNWKALGFSTVMLMAIFLFFRGTSIGEGNEYIRKMRSAFTPRKDASYMVRVNNREIIKVYMADKYFGYGLGLGSKAERFKPKEYMPVPTDSWLVNVWTDTGIVGLCLYVIIHLILFARCAWILRFKIADKRLRNLLTAWLCMNAGFFIAAYGNDVMQYPNIILVYSGFAICFAGRYMEKQE